MRPLIKSFLAAVAVPSNSGPFIVKASAPTTGTGVQLATAATEALVGIADIYGADVGTPIDVTLFGPAQVRLGGNVAFNDPLTTDANGKAIACVGAAATKKVIVGYALAPGALDDIIPIRVAPGILQLT